MKLTRQDLRENPEAWRSKGYALPEYDIETMLQKTAEAPFWIHFGAGNLFRAFHADIAQDLLNRGVLDRGIIAAEGFDSEIIEKMYAPHDNLGITCTLKSNGSVSKSILASVAEALPLDIANPACFSRLQEIFTADSLQLATFTITEKGYRITDAEGGTPAEIAADFTNGPSYPSSYMGKVTALLYARYRSGGKPLAMVSTDNCSHNGDRLRDAVCAFAEAWIRNGKVEAGFADYLTSGRVSFPWTMIDKITPRPDPSVEAILRADGVEDLDALITTKHSYVAPFVNAEETGYLVIEDDFPNGRPPLEAGGLIFTTRETVRRVEKMKVCTCLNPLHTSLAVFGCLLGYHRISDEMQDDDLVRLVQIVGYQEGLPVVINPGILDPKKFLDTFLTVRLPNPFLPDTPQRIATDTSQKLSVRFGETIKAYAASPDRYIRELHLIPVVLAAWLRYLLAVDDEGNPFPLSPDPLLPSLLPCLAGLTLGQTDGLEEAVRPILKEETIFGVDLYDIGMAEAVIQAFREMLAGPGAVRRTLRQYLREGSGKETSSDLVP